MENVSKKYIEKEGKTLKIQVYYSKGGINYATYKTDARGYYLSVTPVTIEKRDGYTMESFTAFSGVKRLLKEVSRKSKKAAAEAEKLAADQEQELINYVLENNKEVL